MKVSIIIPMYNESKIIADTARTLWSYMRESFEDFEIIFFDDGSHDGSRKIVEELELEGVRALGYENNRGKGCAVRHGMLAAEGDIRIFTDADLAYGTDVIAHVCDVMMAGADTDMVLGSRNISKDGYDGYTFARKVMSKIYIKVLCLTGGFKLSDSQCGFKAFRGETAEELFEKCNVDGFAFDFEVILRATAANKNIREMPVKVINHRDSSVRPLGDAFKMLGDLRSIKKDIKSESIKEKNEGSNS